MKVRLPLRPSLLSGCRMADMNEKARARTGTCLIAVLFLLCHSASFAAGPVKTPSSDSESRNPAQSYAPIGDSGYRVPIPEIKINRIFGGQQLKPHQGGEQQREPAPSSPETSQTPTEETGGSREKPRVQWLPFDPSRRTPSLRPPPQRGMREEARPKEEIPPMLKPPTAPDEPFEAIRPKKEVLGALPVPQPPVIFADPRIKESSKPKRLGFRDAGELTGPLEVIALHRRHEPATVSAPEPEPAPRPERVAVSEPAHGRAPHPPPDVLAIPRVQEPPKPKHLGFQDSGNHAAPLASIPLGTRQDPATIPVPEPEPEPLPEPVAVSKPEPAPAPRPERMAVHGPDHRRAPHQPPDVLAVPRVNEPPKSKQLGFQDSGAQSGPLASIPLGTRQEPAAIPAPEPRSEPVAVPEEKPEPRPEPVAVPQPQAEPQPEPVAVPKPEAKPDREPEPTPPLLPDSRETSPVPAPEPVEMKPPVGLPEEPEKEQPTSPAKEVLPSPLDQDAAQNREVRHYLQDTAPILEELSLLMTRAPSLAVADYDPSQDQPAAFREDVYMKIEYMKRELQVLDSKTFAIIPPKKYEGFHSVIRDSITETYQACDTIMAYMRDPSEQNLQRVQEHLRRARELIQTTRTSRG
jgi:hypothetical protein